MIFVIVVVFIFWVQFFLLAYNNKIFHTQWILVCSSNNTTKISFQEWTFIDYLDLFEIIYKHAVLRNRMSFHEALVGDIIHRIKELT